MKNKTKTIIYYFAFILIIILLISLFLKYRGSVVEGDGISQYFPAQHLIEKNNLNMWDPTNNVYQTFYFKFPSVDEAIYEYGKSFPTQSLIVILFTALTMSTFGNEAFFYINILCAIATLFFSLLIIREISNRKHTQIFSILAVLAMPIFTFWSIVPQNIFLLILFYIISIYFLIKNEKTGLSIYLLLSSFFIGMAIFVKPIMILALLGFIPHLAKKSKKDIFIFSIPLALILISWVIFNIHYFGNFYYLGYEKSNYRPVNYTLQTDTLANITKGTYSQPSFSLPGIKYALTYFINGIEKISPIILVGIIIATLWLLPLKRKTTTAKKICLNIFIALITTLVYLSTILDKLWAPDISTSITFPLTLSFFRYLLPFFILFVILASIFLFENLKFKKIFLLICVFLIVILLVFSYTKVITYSGGANLDWYHGYNTDFSKYSSNLSIMPKSNSIILYPERIEISILENNIENYTLFNYDGIPSDFRLNETKRIVCQALKNNRTIYFSKYEEPYKSTLLKKSANDPNIGDMQEFLEDNFYMEEHHDSFFPRIKLTWVEIKNARFNC